MPDCVQEQAAFDQAVEAFDAATEAADIALAFLNFRSQELMYATMALILCQQNQMMRLLGFDLDKESNQKRINNVCQSLLRITDGTAQARGHIAQAVSEKKQLLLEYKPKNN